MPVRIARFALAALLAAAAPARADEGFQLVHQGYLLGASDTPVTQPQLPMVFRIYNARNSGDLQEQLIWSSTTCQVEVRDGRYAVVLGGDCNGTPALDPSHLPPGQSRFLEVTVDGTRMQPRLALGTMPTAMVARRAFDADKLGGAARAEFWQRTDDVSGAKLGATTLAARIDAVEAKIPGVGSTGELPVAVIPSLDASKIAGGTLDAARIPALDASKIASGTLDAARIPSLDAAKLASGTLDAARIPGLDASKIASGELSVARGGTGADLSQTGGPGMFVRQLTSGGPLTVGSLQASDLPLVKQGQPGAVPAPGSADATKFLRGDGTWQAVASPWNEAGGNVTRASGSVGIGTATPMAALDVAGGIRIGNAATCNAQTEGTIRYNASVKGLQVCNGTAWANVTGLPKSCKEALDQGVASTDGNVQLDPDGIGPIAPFIAWCDMSTNGGGWTLALNLDTSDGAVEWYNVTDFWTSSTFDRGADATPFSGDYKRAGAFAGIGAREILVRIHANGATVAWRSWNAYVVGNTLSQYLNGGTSVRVTNGATASSGLATLLGREAVILPAGDLYANINLGSQDLNRLWNNGSTSQDNYTGGLGTFYDATTAECSRPCADALAVSSGGTWSGGLIGSDTDARNQYGSASGVSYDYAIYVR